MSRVWWFVERLLYVLLVVGAVWFLLAPLVKAVNRNTMAFVEMEKVHKEMIAACTDRIKK